MINFAHGEIFMLGAYIALLLVTIGDLGIFWSLIGAMIGSAMLGMIIERVSFRPLRNVSILAPLISTIGLSIFLRSLAQIIFGAESTRFPVGIKTEFFEIGPLQISLLQIVILGISFSLMAVFQIFIKKTKIGKAMRATSESLYTAGLLGIPVDRIIFLSFGVASALGGVAGVLLGLNFNAISPLMGKMVGLKGLVIIILGGMGNITGAMVGGLFLGFVEVLSVGYLASSYRDAVAFALLFLILLIKPTGMFGKETK
jgi:branched-chain amino acid transport system permease protein